MRAHARRSHTEKKKQQPTSGLSGTVSACEMQINYLDFFLQIFLRRISEPKRNQLH